MKKEKKAGDASPLCSFCAIRVRIMFSAHHAPFGFNRKLSLNGTLGQVCLSLGLETTLVFNGLQLAILLAVVEAWSNVPKKYHRSSTPISDISPSQRWFYQPRPVAKTLGEFPPPLVFSSVCFRTELKSAPG